MPRSEPYWLTVNSHNDLPAAFASTKNEGPFWLAGLGNKPTGGYSLRVAPEAKLIGSELLVETITTSPNGKVVSQAFTNPCVLLAATVNTDVTNSRWLENGSELNVAVEPYHASLSGNFGNNSRR